MQKKNLQDVHVGHKKVLVRVDYNVPMDKAGNITDDTRIRATLPTIEYLLSKNAAVILASHLGRPKGKPNPEFSLAPVAKRLSQLLFDKEVLMAPDCVGAATEEMAKALQPGQILLLENLRFHAEEEGNDPDFAKQLAGLAEILVNDAFGVSHRAHASVHGITQYIPAVSGFLMDKELLFLGNAVSNPERPFVAIIGGAKVSDKIGVIENLLGKVDTLIIGGGMANTFLAAQGYQLGKSLVEGDKLELARQLIESAKTKQVNLLLPEDVAVADKFAADAQRKVVSVDQIPAEWMALDIGPATEEKFAKALAGAKTVVWNGPMGVFEFDAFAVGTEAVAKAVAASGAKSVVGGGDSVAALEKLKLSGKITHISTGGGASLELLEGKVLPGIAALADK
ncbi:MAG TPA: phosphoglycerate kinase [Patescibacteria group bacterium]|nr:phosphoglycerate kinase [Patescibacteria group bacterium]